MQFWDGRFGTLLARFSQHEADVLQLAASPDGSMVFAAGGLPAGPLRLPAVSQSHADSKQGMPQLLHAACMHLRALTHPLPATLPPSCCPCCRSAAGVDPRVSLFQRLLDSSSATGSGKQLPWAYLSSKRPHSHDVRAMCVAAGKHLPEGPRLFTGSNDTQLLNHSVPQYLKVRALLPGGGRRGPATHTPWQALGLIV